MALVLLSAGSTSADAPATPERAFSASDLRLSRVCLSRDGNWLAAGGAGGNIAVWELTSSTTTEPRWLKISGGGALTCLEFGPEGLLLAGDVGGKLGAWEAPGFQPIEIPGPKLAVTCAAFRDADVARTIYLGLADGRLAILRNGEVQVQKTTHRGLKCLKFNGDQNLLFSAGSEGQVLKSAIAEARLKDPVRLSQHATEISVLELSPDGKRLASADWNGVIRVFDPTSRKIIFEFSQPDAVSGLNWSNDRITTGSWDGRIRAWNLTAERAEPLAGINTGSPIHQLVVEPSGKQALTVSNANRVAVWNLP